MDILGRNIFWAFFTELLFVILAIVLKEDKRKVGTVLTIGTLIAGIVGFGGAIIGELTNISVFLPETAETLRSSNPTPSAVSPIDNPISITELKDLTLNDQSYQGSAFLDVTLKNNDGVSHSVGLRFWYEETTNGNSTRWIVVDRVIDDVAGSSSSTSRIVFEPGNSRASSISGDKLQAIITSIDNQVIYSSDDVFNAISVELLSTNLEQDEDFVKLTCTFNVTNKLPIPLYAEGGGTYNFSYIEQGKQVYESYGSGDTIGWESEEYWGYGENSMGFVTIPPSSSTQIVLEIGTYLDRRVVKSMEINEVTIALKDAAIEGWIYVSRIYNMSGCVWVN